MANAAVTVADASDAFAHGTTEGAWLAFVGKPRFKGAFAGDGFWRCALAGDGAAHGRCLIAAKVFHSAAVVGGVTRGSREA